MRVGLIGIVALAACGDSLLGMPDGGDDAIDAPVVDAPGIDGGPDALVIDAPVVIDASADAIPSDAMPDAPPAPPIRGWCGPIYPAGDVLMELGHGTRIDLVQRWQGRILTRDVSGRWVLWNADTRAPVASGVNDPALLIEMRGSTLFIQRTPELVELRRTFDGQLGATFPVPAGGRVGIAVDGSYVWTADATSLEAWGGSTEPLFTRAGDYSTAAIFAAPTVLRIANGPAGADRIENVALSGGISTTTPPFLGEFHSWFIEGNSFITVEPGTSVVRVYSTLAMLEATMMVPTTNLHGHWAHLWTQTGSSPSVITLYPLGSSAPAAMYPAYAIATDPTRLAFTQMATGNITITVLDLQPFVFTETQVPVGIMNAAEQLSIDMLGWTLTYGGVVHDSFQGLRPLSCGAALAIAGSGAGRVAVATETGRIFYFDVSSGTYQLIRTLPVRLDPARAFRRFTVLSDDGSILVTGAHGRGDCGADPSIRVFDMTTGTLIDERRCVRRDYTDDRNLPLFELAKGGTRILRLRSVTDLTGTPVYTLGAGYWAKLSPSGARAMSRNGDDGLIYENGALIGTAAGVVGMGWIDESRLLFQRFDGTGTYIESEIRDPSGAVLATLPLPELRAQTFERRLTPIDATRIYLPDHDAIHSLADGSELWSSTLVTGSPPARAQGDVAGSRVVTPTDHRVVVESY